MRVAHSEMAADPIALVARRAECGAVTLHAAGVPNTTLDSMAGHPVTLVNEVPVHALGESQ